MDDLAILKVLKITKFYHIMNDKKSFIVSPKVLNIPPT